MNYTFVPAATCNMCGSNSRKIKGRRLNTSQGLRPKNKVGISTTVMECRDCGLVYADPLPVPKSIEDHYGMPPESYWKNGSMDIPPDHFKNEIAGIRSVAPHANTFLDIGSGTGKTLVTALNKGFDAYGIEASKPFFDRAAARLTDKSRIKHVAFEDAEFPDASFDVISFGVVLEHLYDPSAAIRKALKWLSPKGVIHIEVPEAGYLYSKLFKLYFRLAMTDYVVNISPMHVPFHLYEFTERSFRENGKKSGYEIARIERYPGVPPMSVFRHVHPLLRPVMDLTGTGVGLIVYLRHCQLSLNTNHLESAEE